MTAAAAARETVATSSTKTVKVAGTKRKVGKKAKGEEEVGAKKAKREPVEEEAGEEGSGVDRETGAVQDEENADGAADGEEKVEGITIYEVKHEVKESATDADDGEGTKHLLQAAEQYLVEQGGDDV